MTRARHTICQLVIGLAIAWMVRNPDGTPFSAQETAWPLEVTVYFVTLNGWEMDADGNPQPIYSAANPARYFIRPDGSDCREFDVCLRLPGEPAPGDVWMYEETPVWMGH